MNLQEYHNKLQQLKGQKKQIEKEISSIQDALSEERRNLKNIEGAQIIMQLVAKQTQQELEIHISEIVTLALDTIFDDPYEFKLEFVEKRGKTEADLWLMKDGEKIDPLSSTGGGVVDVCSFALRIALWNLKKPKSRNTMILDEPFKWLSKDLLPRAAELLKTLSEKLNIQFIIVTHLDELKETADTIFKVSISSKGISRIVEVVK
jgi:DNA repair exonuclease SbcCD ATPase subunit